MDAELQKAREVLAGIPLLGAKGAAEAKVERLGGLTNKNWKVDVGGKSYVLRIPGEGTEEYINRQHEEIAARITADVGVNAPIVYFGAANGVQLASFLEGAITLNTERYKDLGAVRRSAVSLRAVHQSGKQFANRFELFAMIDEYLALLQKKNAQMVDGYAEVQKEAEAVRQVLAEKPSAIVPCHCDPLAENFLDDGNKVWVVDWEYSGNNDPMWDLGDLSVEAAFNEAQDAALMEAYFDGAPPADQMGRMVIYKAMCDLLWTLWGLIQHADDNPAEDFWAYSVERFERCQALMGRDDFGKHIEAVRRG